jgi:hypothetical protein
VPLAEFAWAFVREALGWNDYPRSTRELLSHVLQIFHGHRGPPGTISASKKCSMKTPLMQFIMLFLMYRSGGYKKGLDAGAN